MSSLIGKFLTILGFKRREANVLVVGLDNSGKSTILNYLKRKEDQVEEVVPTVGFNVERLSGLARNKSGISLTAFDMSGQGRYRNLWEHYYNNVEGIIFVVDSTDALRLVVARDELEMMLKHQLSQGEGEEDEEAQNGETIDDENNENREDKPIDEEDEMERNGNHQTPNTTKMNNRPRGVPARAAFSRNNSMQSQSSTKSNSSGSRLKTSNSSSSLGSSTSSSSSTVAATSNMNTNPNANFRRPDIPILFFANKMDLKDALPSVKISQMLGLQSFPHRNWHIQVSNAISGEGIQDGVEWLIYQIAQNKKNGVPNSTSSGSIATMAK